MRTKYLKINRNTPPDDLGSILMKEAEYTKGYVGYKQRISYDARDFTNDLLTVVTYFVKVPRIASLKK